MRDFEHQLGRPEREADGAREIPRRKYPRWGRIAAVALVGAAAAWAIGREASMRIEKRDIEISSRRQAPALGYPAASRTEDHNNMIILDHPQPAETPERQREGRFSGHHRRRRRNHA